MNSPFNEAKYRALLEGLEVSIILFSKSCENKDFRIDSDFFTKAPTVYAKHTYVPIGSILKTAQYGISIEMNQEQRGYPIYRMNEIHNMLCDFEVDKHADISLNEFQKFKLNDRDVLFNRTNSYEWVGRTGIYRKTGALDFTFASYLVRFIPDEGKVLPEYLTAFLNSSVGVWDIKRRARHSINQTNVNPEEVKAIMIPLLGIDFQYNIKSLFDVGYQKLLLSQNIYSQAETLLLEALGLNDFDFDAGKEVHSNVKMCSASFLASGRLDAEYYQRKYEVLEHICLEKSAYTKKIAEIQQFNARGLQPEYVENGEVDIINSRHILEKHLDYDSFERTTLFHWEKQGRAQVFENDILIYTTGANIGRSQVYLSSKKALASNHVNILRIKNEDPIYTAFVLNSKIGRLQTEQLSAGSAQQELYPKDIAKFYVPYVRKEDQVQISNAVKESFCLQTQSKILFHLAKQAVETAIEQGEAAGMALLEMHKLNNTTV